MRFTTVWADTLAQNVTLKAVVASLCVVCVVFALTAAKLALKQPVVIERECYSKVVNAVSAERTNTEIEAFLKEALSQRFDTNTSSIPGFLSSSEENFRRQEQETLKGRNVTQRVLFGSAKIEGSKVEALTDRILSVGEVRSALTFPLSITLSTQTRTASNPYGLELTRVSPISDDKSRKEPGKQ